MKNTKICLTLLIAMFLFVSKISFSWGLQVVPAFNNHTHTRSNTTSSWNRPTSFDSFQLAKVHWLPDYQYPVSKRSTSNSSSGAIGGVGAGDIGKTCATYGFLSSAPYNKACRKIQPLAGLHCFTDCKCPSSFKYTEASCPLPSFLGENFCEEDGVKIYDQCEKDIALACKSFTNTCPAGQQLATKPLCKYDPSYGICCNICSGFEYNEVPDGYKEVERCASCMGFKYKITENDCSGFIRCLWGGAAEAASCQKGAETLYQTCHVPTCTEGGYLDTPPVGKKCLPVSYKGLTCQASCYQPTCSEGGYVDNIPTNQKCTAVSYYGKTCQSDCTPLTCADGGFKENCDNELYLCTAQSFGGKTCWTQGRARNCADGGFQSSVPANQKCTPVTYAGKTCQSNCYQPQCSEGGFQATVPTNHVCSPLNYYGRICQSNCYQPQCSEGGYLATVPARKICNAVSYYGRTCQKDCACAVGSIEYCIVPETVCESLGYTKVTGSCVGKVILRCPWDVAKVYCV